MSTPPKSRKRGRYHHGNLPAALLEAALEMLEAGDIDALTLREVARRVGVTHAAPYRHFKDKAALLSALAEEGFERLRTALGDARRTSTTAEQAIDASRACYLRFAREHHALFRLMFTPERAADPRVASAAEQLLADVERALGQLTASGAPRHDAVRVWAEWHGLATLRTGGWLGEPALGHVAREPIATVHKSAVGDGGHHDDH